MFNAVINRNDVWVSDTGTGDSLASKTLCHIGIVCQMRLEQLDSHLAMKKCVACKPNFGHSASGNAVLELISAANKA
jgi:hypothetical protein